jgi:hypothetical protein
MTDRSLEELQAESRELDEAVAAIGQARLRVAEATERLGSAHSWGTYDTWFGGGLFSSMIKHDRIDDADRAMGQVDAALETVRRELADVGVAPVGGVGVDPLHRTLDVWFDNFFTDMGTQGRIKDAQGRLSGLSTALDRAEEELRRRSTAIEAEIRVAGG